MADEVYNKETYEYWEDVIYDLCEHPEVKGPARKFVEDLASSEPPRLTDAQIKWLQDLEDNYLV